MSGSSWGSCYANGIDTPVSSQRSLQAQPGGAMDFFQNPYHRINAILLIAVGQWPYHTSKWHRFQQILFHVNIATVIIAQGIKMFELRRNVDIVIECITPIGVQVVAMAKSVNCMLNQLKMKNLLERMKNDWYSLTNEHEIKIFEKYAEDGRRLSVAYAAFLLGSMMPYLIIPLMPQILNTISPLNESRQRVFMYHTEYFVDGESHYYAIVLHTYSGTIMTILTVVATDTMFAVYVQHVCGILAVLGYRLRNITSHESLKFDVKIAIRDDVNYKELLQCIKIHQRAIKFAVLVETAYTKLFLIQLGISTLLISISLLQLLTKFGQYEEMYRLIQFICGQYIHLFFNYRPGQKLIDESMTFRDSNFDSYASQWYTFSLRARSVLKILMLEATSPLKITANRLQDITMERFGQVVQTSISYFTVLASLR